MEPKYARPAPVDIGTRRWPDSDIGTSPIWCAVDLRDGNQALPDPMTPPQKKRYFQLLTDIGFKQIEIGFPSASADDFQFCRALIEENRIPDDVTISVLTQARPHLIDRTIEALAGAKRAICHVYIATSDLHMGFVFNKTRDETRQTALEAVARIRDGVRERLPDSNVRLEFSPEEFTDTDLDFAVELCDAVVETWEPKPGERVILNLPATVERRLPHQYADMIEEFMRRQHHGELSVISLHAHNDMGSAIAATEMALMAGAQRVEGTLFGHGERSGNVDLVTLALNLHYLGVDTGLDFGDIEEVRDLIVDLTGIPAHPRQPYVGELVFTAFSGSHQDAIHKGLSKRDTLARHFGGWKVPYLHVDPGDFGRSYERFIRINSQSGKGGVAHVLEQDYGVRLPRNLLVDLSRHVQVFADQVSREVEGAEVWSIFQERYVRREAPLRLLKYWPRPNAEDPSLIEAEAHVAFGGKEHVLEATGNGPIAAFVHAIRQLGLPDFTLAEYEEDALGATADADAVAFIRLDSADGRPCLGVGFGANIDQAAVKALVSAVNEVVTPLPRES